MCYLTSLMDSLIGTFELVSCQSRSTSGQVENLHGEKPFGRLMYGADGRMSVLIYDSEQWSSAPEDPQRVAICDTPDAFTGFLAYTGSYKCIADSGEVVHLVEGCNILSWIGSEQRRFFQLSNSQLTITTAPFERNGEEWVATLEWKRI